LYENSPKSEKIDCLSSGKLYPSKMTLKLSINKKAFDVMVSGEKTEEFRDESKWIMSRLKKDYDFVQFTNGYGDERPVFVAKFLGYTTGDVNKKYSNGLSVEGNKIIIKLGEIVEKRNLKI